MTKEPQKPKIKFKIPKPPYIKVSFFKMFLFLLFFGFVLGFFNETVNITRNNRTKKTIAQLQKYTSAIEMFQKKYGQLPGDLKKTEIFGLSINNTDGNQNGLIEDKDGNIIQASGEITNFWLHLTNSGFLDEKFDGKENQNAKIGSTFPKINGFGLSVFGFEGENYLQIGIVGATSTNISASDRVLMPDEAFVLDKKIDDGFPDSGNILAVGGEDFVNGTDFVNKKCATKREYLIKLNEPACQLRIKIEK